MRKLILYRVFWAENYLNAPDLKIIDSVISDLSRWISYFQHERLVHLIVTVVVAIITMMSVFLVIYFGNVISCLLLAMLTLLLLFYIGHYYLLENKTQYLYKIMDRIVALKESTDEQ